MNWYDHLYVGERAGKRRFAILEGLRQGRWQPEVYVIMPPQSGNNILEILPSVMLLVPPYRDREYRIVGVAVTYWEALEVVRRIIDDLYQRTGGFCLEELIGSKTVPEPETTWGPETAPDPEKAGEPEMAGEPKTAPGPEKIPEEKESTMRGELC